MDELVNGFVTKPDNLSLIRVVKKREQTQNSLPYMCHAPATGTRARARAHMPTHTQCEKQQKQFQEKHGAAKTKRRKPFSKNEWLFTLKLQGQKNAGGGVCL